MAWYLQGNNQWWPSDPSFQTLDHNKLTLHWCRMSAMASQITSKLTICSTDCLMGDN